MIENPVPWPNGARVAVAITFDIDADSILHLDHPKHSHQMVAAQSLLRYDRIAVKRILELYRRFGLKQTFFFPAWCMEQYPDLVEAILEDGHEIAHHGYIHESPNKQASREDERHWLQRGIDVIERMTGSRPRGWRAPLYDFSEHSADLLIEEGFLYDASLMGDDVPYILTTERGEIVELPSHWALDDWPQYAYMPEFKSEISVRAPDDAMRVYMAEFEAAHRYGGLWIAVWHPTVSGRLARCDRMATMIEDMMNKGSVWFATLEEITQHVASCREAGTFTPRVEPMPTYAKPLPEETFTVPG
ncbi:MAG: polysaccharide deacetylase [Deltaproteobacteria bacterium]|nr:polysaccharide deacetylase [Deltaproteobacteria bacterium]MBW2691220.1 polysaccharide deacetylase [Deltaproteobacteria bacterium]